MVSILFKLLFKSLAFLTLESGLAQIVDKQIFLEVKRQIGHYDRRGLFRS